MFEQAFIRPEERANVLQGLRATRLARDRGCFDERLSVVIASGGL